MTFSISADQLQQITTHAERAYPEECCGILLGTRQAEGAMLVEVMATVNAWSAEVAADLSAAIADSQYTAETARRDRYWIDPRDLLQTQKAARDRQLDIVGIYHSHPDHPAVPSETDRLLAWAEYCYIIVSVRQGIANQTSCWKLDQSHQFQPEDLVVE